MPAARRRLFLLATLLLPVLLFASLEGLLRVIGFGGGHPLFVDYAPLPGMRHANALVMRRYVDSPGEPAARIDPFLFQSSKAPDVRRFVVQGGSTAAGFPYGRWAGLAGMLSDRLAALYPEREFELVSTAMAAVNSYTLADLVAEIIEIEPDAVLVYAGHNEYLGLLGVGSALHPSSSRAVARLRIRLRHWRVYQLIERVVGSARAFAQGGAGTDRDTLFALAASGARIPFGSDAYRAGLAQFEANLSELLSKYRRAGVPVYVGTLVSNEKLPPFVGGPAEGVDRTEWDHWREEARARRAAGQLDLARSASERLLALDPDSADAWYALAALEEQAGRFDAAREAYRAARDRDALRFRAPGDMNPLIRVLAARHGARVVEVEQRFVAASSNEIVADELMLEHVHPNAEGYRLLAEAFLDALGADGRLGNGGRAITRGPAPGDVPLTELDLLCAEYQVREMKAGFPFADPPQSAVLPAPRNEIERIAQRLHRGELDRLHAMEAVLQLHRRQGRIEEAAKVARLAAEDYPADHGPNYAAGALLAQSGDHARARRYLERSLRAAPGDVPALEASIGVDRALGDEDRLRVHLEALRRVAPAHPLLESAGEPAR